MKIPESEILESLLKHAAPDLKKHAAEAAQTAPKCEADREFWTQALPAFHEIATQDTAGRDRSIHAVMQRLANEELRPRESAAASTPIDFSRAVRNRNPIARRAVLAACSAAACVALVAGFSYMGSKPVREAIPHAKDAIGPLAAHVGDSHESNTRYVRFGADAAGSGAETDPFGTLASAVDSARPGETIKILGGSTGESIKIERHMIIVAANGAARIGAF